MYKALFKYFLFAISSCVACISESVPRRLYQPVAALGFSSSCWEARTGWCAETRGLLWAHVRDLECSWPRSARGSWWALLLRSWLSGQNVRTSQEAVQPVRHFQGGQDCRCCVVKGMMFACAFLRVPFPNGLVCSLLYLSPELGGAERGNRWKSSCPSAWRWLWVLSNHFMPNMHICKYAISCQSDNLLWHASRCPFRELSLATFPVLCC